MSRINLDITKDHCPMTFVKTKLQLERMDEGDILEILLTAGEPLENVPRTVTEQGFQVLETLQVKGDIYKVVIKK
ncbi:MAG: sulfurtransferase TusA family protein [Geobacteraceae bacterium]|jgi:TusA-related sulfurtransferase